MCRLPASIGVRGRQVRPETDLSDVGDPCPAQPVSEVRGLEVGAELGRALRAVDRARVDYGRLPAGQQSGIAALRVEAEHHSWLTDHVDELLEYVGDAVVPHRHAEQVA